MKNVTKIFLILIGTCISLTFILQWIFNIHLVSLATSGIHHLSLKLVFVNDSNTCYEQKNNERKFYCYESFFKKIRNVEQCRKVTSDFYSYGNAKEVCFRVLAEKLKNPDLCMEIVNNEDIRSVCYTQVAIAALDENICRLASASNRRGQCFSDLAQKLNDPKLCFQAGMNSDSCFTQLAYERKDASLCDNVNNLQEQGQEQAKEKCLRYVRGERNPVPFL